MAMRLGWLISAVVCGLCLATGAAQTPSQWEQPAAALAEQINAILGPGQAQLTLRNISTIAPVDVAQIRRMLEQDLKAHGVLTSGAESANSIRITLSESERERLWVAEVVEGNATRVAMVHVDFAPAASSNAEERIILRKERLRGIAPSDEPILGAIETKGGLVILLPESLVVVAPAEGLRTAQRIYSLGHRQNLTRDPRGVLSPTRDAGGFTAFAAGVECDASEDSSPVSGANGWAVRCHEGDDPWPVAGANAVAGGGSLRAFFNTARNFFTGVVTPGLGVDLPPFYSVALLPRPAGGAALLIDGIDSKVQMLDNNVLRQVAGTRDWGSDFAVLHSECGGGTQVIASGSGEAATDSLRAYEIPALEAVPASAPLTMEGTVTALWTVPDGNSVMAVVRDAANQYEVDRVTVLCN